MPLRASYPGSIRALFEEKAETHHDRIKVIWFIARRLGRPNLIHVDPREVE